MSEAADQGMPSRGRARAGRSLPWRRDPAILARLPEVERRHLAGWPNTRIAEDLRVDETTIRRDLERIRELWRARAGARIEELRAVAVAQLDDVRRRALAAAEFDEAAERAVLYGMDGAGESVAVLRDERGKAEFRGNKAAALQAARQATMDIAKVLGLIVDKVAPTDGRGDDLDLATLMQRAREARARREAGADGRGAE